MSDDQFKDLKKIILDVRGDVQLVQQQVDTLQQDVTTLKKDMNTVKGNVKEIKENVADLHQEMTNSFGSIGDSIQMLIDRSDKNEGILAGIHHVTRAAAT